MISIHDKYSAQWGPRLMMEGAGGGPRSEAAGTGGSRPVAIDLGPHFHCGRKFPHTSAA